MDEHREIRRIELQLMKGSAFARTLPGKQAEIVLRHARVSECRRGEARVRFRQDYVNGMPANCQSCIAYEIRGIQRRVGIFANLIARLLKEITLCIRSECSVRNAGREL